MKEKYTTQLKESIERAKAFLFDSRDERGLWRDFSTGHGESVEWVSGYIGHILLESGLPVSALVQSAQSLYELQNKKYGGWGYNEIVIPDADSTAFAMMFLSPFDYDLDQAKSFLKKHQNTDGGFGTYLPELIRNYNWIPTDMSTDGWCNSNCDVTASALQVIEDKEEAINYLKRQLEEQHILRSYWYNNNSYAVARGVQVLKKRNQEEIVEKEQYKLAQLSFVPIVPFYLALETQYIMGNKNYSQESETMINILAGVQFPDGSWESYPLLRFPLPCVTEPWNDARRLRKDNEDQNRFFTTATCLETLVMYKQQLGME